MKCEQCGNEFEAQRSTARFCSAKCRVAYNRDSGPKTPCEQAGEQVGKTPCFSILNPDIELKTQVDVTPNEPNVTILDINFMAGLGALALGVVVIFVIIHFLSD